MAAPLLGGFHLGFVTGRIARPVKEPPLQISTATGTSPRTASVVVRLPPVVLR